MLITGGSSGIGKAIAMMGAREGAIVVVADINTVEGEKTVAEIKARGNDAIFFHFAAGSAQDHEELVEQIIQRFSRLDVACNNAGIGGISAVAAEYPLDEWDRILRINLSGVFYGCKYQIPAMIKSGGGAIVNMASILSVVAIPESPAYTAAKHGVLGLTRTLSLDYSKKGIRINAVAPGFIETAINSEMLADKNIRNQLLNAHPIGRFGCPEEVAELVVWLLSERASFVSGAYYPVDGGYLAN